MSTFQDVEESLRTDRDNINALLNELIQFRRSDLKYTLTTAQKDTAIATLKAALPSNTALQAFDGTHRS
jgi:hypothetical protein